MVIGITQFSQGIDSYAKDEDLVYYGDDPLVWDRINAERLRRGLPPLPNPRPVDPDAVTVPVSGATAGSAEEREQLRQLETRRDQLIGQVSTVQRSVFTNEVTLARKRIELADVTDPSDRAAILSQIAILQSNISRDQKRLAPLEANLVRTDQEVQASISQVFPDIPGIPKVSNISPANDALSKLRTAVVSIPVDAANVLKQLPATVKIPGLDTSQVTGMLSSLKTAAQSAGAAISSQGVGEFALSPSQLEQQGFLKPGAVDNFIANRPPPEVTEQDLFEAERINQQGGDITPEQVAQNRQLNSVLSSPNLWTGKSGCASLGNFTNNSMIQNLTQQNLMSTGLDQLKKLGVVNGAENPAQLASLVQSAGKFGADAVAKWSQGSAPSDVTNQITNVAKDAQQALKVVDTQIPSLGALPFNPAGAVATVDRKQLDTAFNSILGNPKIPIPSFGGAGLSNLGEDLYASTPDEKLTYTGSDAIVWDRVNAERLRRGLPGLAAIGYPRPPDDEVDRNPGDLG